MSQEYLPGTLRSRIEDLMKERRVTQKDLAAMIGSSESTLSRFLSGKTDTLSHESIIRIARIFRVSTDFLLGVVNTPDRKNYDITELGLSVEAARNLYTERVCTGVVNRLLESARFSEVTYMIQQYFDDTFASGVAAQNAMFSTISTMLRNNVKTDAANQAIRDINRQRVPVYQHDLTTIQENFMASIKEVKKEIGSDFSGVQRLTKEKTEEMFNALTKGQDLQHPEITAEQIAGTITGAMSGVDGIEQEALDELGSALVKIMQGMEDYAKKEAAKEHGESEQ